MVQSALLPWSNGHNQIVNLTLLPSSPMLFEKEARLPPATSMAESACPKKRVFATIVSES